MYITTAIGGSGDGIFPPKIGGITCKNVGAANRVRGSLMVLDMASATATTTNPGQNAGTSVWNTLKDVAAGSSAVSYPACILEADINLNATGKVTFYGIVNAVVAAAGAGVGVLLMPDTAAFGLILAAGATGRVCAVQLTARDAGGRAFVFFDGLTLGGPVA